MIRVFAVALFVSCTRAVPPDAAADPEEFAPAPGDPLPMDPDVHHGVLDNGLRWYFKHNDYPAERAELRLVVDAGSVLETDEQVGGAHFVEHMAFNGTEHFPGAELVRFLESTGAAFGPHLNAATSFDSTVYKLQIATTDAEDVERSFLVMRDWAQGVVFDPVEFEDERPVVLEEWRRTRGASGRTTDVLLPALFQGSLYADRKPIGTEESLGAMTREALVAFYRDWYRPELMAVVVVGDLEAARVEELVASHFGGLTTPESPPERVEPPIPDHADPVVVVHADPEATDSQVGVMQKRRWRWPADHAGYRALVVEELAMDMLNERFNEVARRPGAPFLGAGAGRSPLTPSTWLLSLGCASREGQVEQAAEAMMEELQRARVHGFTAGELERSRARLARAIDGTLAERGSTHSLRHVDELVRHVLTGEYVVGIVYEHALKTLYLEQIALEDVDGFIDGWLGPSNRVIVATVPEKAGLAVPAREALAAAVERGERALTEPWVDEAASGPLVPDPPEPGSVVAVEEIDAIGVLRWTLSNGVTVLVKPTDFKEDEVLIRSYGWGGHSNASDADFFAASTAVSIARGSGVGPFDRDDLDRYLAGRKAWIAPWIGENGEGVNGSASPGDLETALELVYAYVRAPRFDEDAFALEKQNRAERLRNRDADPNALFDDCVSELDFGDHLRRRPWTVGDLDAMDLARSADLYAERFATASGFTFVIVGAVDPVALEPLVARWLATLPADGPPDTWVDVGARMRQGVERREVELGLEPKARARIAITGPDPYTRENAHRLYVLGRVLEIALREEIREELGGTYSISVSTNSWYIPESNYSLQVVFDADPARIDDLLLAVREVLEAARRGEIEPRLLDSAKEQIRRSREEDMERNGAWARWLVDYHQRGWPLTDIATYLDLLETNSTETLRASAERYLRTEESWLQAVLRPAPAASEP